MKILKIKLAYTLIEILIVISLIGIISAIATHSIKNGQNQYKKLYSVAYDSLLQSIGNMALDWTPEGGTAKCSGDTLKTFYWSPACWEEYLKVRTINTAWGCDASGGNCLYYGSKTSSFEVEAVGGIAGFPRDYPGFLFGSYDIGNFDGSGTDKQFCKNLTKRINTLDENNQCKSFISGVRPGKDMNIGENFLETFCALIQTDNAGNEGTNPDGTFIEKCAGEGSIIPSFIASNGQKFYISTVLYANPPYINGGVQTRRLPFRLIAVDINGDNGPNTQLKKGSRLPDIVLFAVVPNRRADGNLQGMVIPVGLPEFTESYLSTQVTFPKYLNEEDPTTPGRLLRNTAEYSDIMSLYRAKNLAYAGTLDDFTHHYLGQPLVKDQAFSYSNLLYYMGQNCHPDGCSAKDGMGNKYYVDKLLANLVWQFVYSTEHNGEKNNFGEDLYVPDSFVPVKSTGNVDNSHGCEPADKSKCGIKIAD